MTEEIDFKERYDIVLNIMPNYGVDRIKKPVKFNYIGLEIEIAVNYTRERYTFIRTLLKKMVKAVGENGYFTSDGTIKGDYSFEIVLDPMSVKRAKKIYSTILKIVRFSDGSLSFDKEHNCGLHMNFNQYDIEDMEESHGRLLLLIKEKERFFEENVYKRTVYDFDFDEYLEFQKEISDKYIGINYLNKKIVEVRNIKVGLSANDFETIATDIVNALFLKKLPKKEKTTRKSFRALFNDSFIKTNGKVLSKAIDNELIMIKLTENGPEIIDLDKEVVSLVEEVARIKSNEEPPLIIDVDENIINASEMEVI